MNILFLSSWYPYPADNGSKLRVFNLLRGLAQQHQITLLTFAELPLPASGPVLSELCQEVRAVPRRLYNPTSARALGGLFSLTPRSVLDTYQPQMAAEIRRVVAEKKFDLVIASQWWTAVYWPSFDSIPAIYEEVETGLLSSKLSQAATPLQRLRHYLPLLKLASYMRRLLPHFKACTVVSTVEKSQLQSMAPTYSNIQVIPNGIETAVYANIQATPRPNTLIFSGSLSYSANLDGIRWFLTEVYPKIQARIPTVKLMITGKSDNIPLPPAENVTLTGFVDDIRPLIKSAQVSLAPIRLGGGTRLKILEAMAAGTPVVATSKGAEGIDVINGKHLLIADSPEQYASAVVQLLRDPELSQKIAENGCRLIRQQYDWSIIMPDFLRLSEETVHGQ